MMKRIILAILLLASPAWAAIPKKKNTATYITFEIFNASTGALISGATDLDCKRSGFDDGTNPPTFSDVSGTETEIGSTGTYYVALNATDTNFDYIYIQCKSSSPNAMTWTGLIDTIHGTVLTNASGQLSNGTIAASSFSSGAIDATAIAADAIGASEIATNAIGDAEIADASFTRSTYAADGTLQSATPTTATLASAESYADNALANRVLCIVSGTGSGQCRVIASNVATTDVVTIFNSWATNPDNTSGYQIGGTADANVIAWDSSDVPTVNQSGRPLVDISHINGGSTLSNAATLNLKQLNVVNDSGTAIVASSSGSNGHGIAANGNGSGHGMYNLGGATGHGIYNVGGATSGHGMSNQASGNGNGVTNTGGSSSNYGSYNIGSGSGSGLYTQGGSTGAGAQFVGGSSSGSAIAATTTSGDGITITPSGTNKSGIVLNATGTGVGLSATLGTDAITAAAISAAAANKVSDHVLRRTTANVEASSNGDTLGWKSLYGATSKQVHPLNVSGSNLNVYKSDGTTLLKSQTITTTSGAQPITGIGN